MGEDSEEEDSNSEAEESETVKASRRYLDEQERSYYAERNKEERAEANPEDLEKEKNTSAANTSRLRLPYFKEPGRQLRLLVVSIQSEHQDLSNEPEI